jgi:putative copper export protein/mono/diheme cytochrome c family protein
MDRIWIATALLRGVHLAASLSLFGCLVFRNFVMPQGSPAEGLPVAAVNRIGWVSGCVALLAGGAWLVAVAGTMAGADSLSALFDAVWEVARHTDFGNYAGARLLLLAGVLMLPRWQHPRARLTALLVTAAALTLQPMIGHIGASGIPVLIVVEMAHLLAAGTWIGGLLPLLVCVIRMPAPAAAELCERFTPVGLVAVGTIAVTALPQAAELIGGLPQLFGTQYGHMALIKLGLFALALSLACLNRLVLTTSLGPPAPAARRWLIVSIAIEVAAVSCVVLAASAMASSPPAAHVQPVWPFVWRPSLDTWQEPELRGELVRLLAAAIVGVALIVISQLIRRFRLVALGLAAIIVAPFASSAKLLLVEAYPSSYMRSPTGFSVDAIALGQTLFGERCAICHDPQIGTGSGADLTAAHLWEHLDGELFWWITDGVTDPEGAALMPGFGSVLPEDDRWALIDFIRARNVGRQVAATGKWSPPVPAPSTPLSCADGNADSFADLAANVLIVVIERGPSAIVPAGIAPGGAPPGEVTIRIARGSEEQPKKGECVAVAPTAWEAWRVLAGVATDQFAGYRAIVDGQGWLRAWLPPGTAPERVFAAIRDAREHPIAAGERPGGGHHHR